jgi:hypothetical protein
MIWAGDRVVLWGGESGSSVLASGRRYVPGEGWWTSTSSSPAPDSTYQGSGVWTGNEMVVWGSASSVVNAGGRYDPALDAWRPMQETGAPTSRYGQDTVWTGDVMVVWGGSDPHTGALLNTGGRYSPMTNSWSPTTTAGAPSARYYPTTVWTGSRMLVWGGADFTTGTYFADGGQYDPVADAWSPITTANAPSARYLASAVWTGTRMIVWSGSDAAGTLVTGARYDPAADHWDPISVVNAPTPRKLGVSVWTGTRMIVWGGESVNGPLLATGGLYDPAQDQWSATSTTGAPAGRYWASAVWTGSRMIVWGGQGIYSNDLDTGGIYDPVGNSWVATTQIGAPAPRYGHTAVWTGTWMVIWGGDSSLTANGGRFVYGVFDDLDHDGFTPCGGDCNDTRADIFPGATEICSVHGGSLRRHPGLPAPGARPGR